MPVGKLTNLFPKKILKEDEIISLGKVDIKVAFCYNMSNKLKGVKKMRMVYEIDKEKGLEDLTRVTELSNEWIEIADYLKSKDFLFGDEQQKTDTLIFTYSEARKLAKALTEIVGSGSDELECK